MIIEPGNRILFQGDSITDCGRSYEDDQQLGNGYAAITAKLLTETRPDDDLTFLNRGISGHRAVDLEKRWDRDCIALKADVVSIMIGINDTWRRYDSNDPTTIETYCTAYRTILEQTAATGAKLVLVEPFVLPHPPDRIPWREDLDPKIDAVQKFAKEFDAILVPMDQIMNEACSREKPEFWAPDGVHPTPAGHALIAQSWIKHVTSS